MDVQENSAPQITQMLRDWAEGRREALDEALPYIYGELRRQAARALRRERANHSLQTTGLVHEAYLKLIGQGNIDLKSRAHFFALAGQTMRRILVDYARTRNREKRGGGSEDVPLEELLLAGADETNIDVIALDEALSRLAQLDPQQESIVELRYFCGLSLEEAADVAGVSRATAAREWSMAKAWLYRELTR